MLRGLGHVGTPIRTEDASLQQTAKTDNERIAASRFRTLTSPDDHEEHSLVVHVQDQHVGSGRSTPFNNDAELIMSIERQKDGSVWVRLSESGGVGETATVLQTEKEWQVTEVTMWVA